MFLGAAKSATTTYYDILKKDEEAVYFDGVEDLAKKIDFYISL